MQKYNKLCMNKSIDDLFKSINDKFHKVTRLINIYI